MKEKTEETELQERTDTQAMKIIDDLYILSGIPLFYKFLIISLSNNLCFNISTRNQQKREIIIKLV